MWNWCQVIQTIHRAYEHRSSGGFAFRWRFLQRSTLSGDLRTVQIVTGHLQFTYWTLSYLTRNGVILFKHLDHFCVNQDEAIWNFIDQNVWSQSTTQQRKLVTCEMKWFKKGVRVFRTERTWNNNRNTITIAPRQKKGHY